MPVKIILLSSIFLISIGLVNAQTLDLNEKEPVISNGIEYGYIIKNEQTKSISKEDYSRYEVSLSATNKSGCTKLYADKVTGLVQNNVLVNFSCLNANGKRLTSKTCDVEVTPFMVTVKVLDKNQSLKAGYIFRNGETIRKNIIVLVSKGERPRVSCTVNALLEL